MGNRQSGNIFFALFGAIALVGILGAGVMTFMKGPLATSVKLTRQNTAETQMALGAQVAVMAAANTASGGDCDNDGYVEPLEWRDAGAVPKPTGGGLVPMSIGMTKKDPWGTEYGYCAWDYGTFGAGGCGGGTEKRLQGASASGAYPVVALVSAGQDKIFTTTCRSFPAADVNGNGNLLDAVDLPLVSKAAETDDDIIFTYTYDEATGASGGLWSIKSGDPGTAVIGKNIETTGTANLQGGVLLPDSTLITCDPTTAGIMARNATGTGIEICDGTGWTAISGGGGVSGSGLVLSPNVSNGMNVNGTCGSATCYSSNVVFTVTNNLSPAAASAVLAVTLSNTTNFEKVSDGCNGVSLAAGANCQVVVRAKATGNISYAGTLNIIGNNSPLAMLDGTSTSFPGCNAGGQTTGGYFVACGVGSGYNLVVTPSGCSGGVTNPVCAGGADTVAMAHDTHASWPTGGYANQQLDGNNFISNGATNTATSIGYSGGIFSFAAVNYCASLVYGGYDDWFLPSADELGYLYANKSTVGSAPSGSYWSSTARDLVLNHWSNLNIQTGVVTGASGNLATNFVRCMRMDPTTPAVPIIDTTPIITALFSPTTVSTAAQTVTSNTTTIYGITQPINVSIAGGTGAMYSKNGGAYTNTPSTVTNGDQITLRANSPAASVEDTVNLITGAVSTSWKVRTAANNTIRVFTTKNNFSTGNFGSLGAADSHCTTKANLAGLGGNWVAVAAMPNQYLTDRLPWNWTHLNNMVGTQVASSLADFLDGSISAPMNYGEDGNVTASSVVWTGLDANGMGNNGGWANCINWTNDVGGYSGAYGDSSSTGGAGYFRSGSTNCGNPQRLLCMEVTGVAGADGDPDAVYVAPAVAYTAGGVATSNTVTVTGIVGTIMVTITPSGGSANIIKNGTSVGASTVLVSNNDTIAFSLTVPGTAGQRNTANLTFGPDSYTWWAGYADSANIGMIFTSSQTYEGRNLGGLSGADTKCQALATAAGLNGTWVAMLSSSTTNLIDRIPFNFGELRRVDQAVLAANWAVMWSGSLNTNPYMTESRGVPPSTYSITGSSRIGIKDPVGGDYCGNWSVSSGAPIRSGLNNVQNNNWLEYAGDYCYYGRSIYCMAALTPAQNNKPATLRITPVVVTTSGARGTSTASNITGITTAVPISISGASGSPALKINGGSEITSGSVTNGNSVEFLMDAPATAGNKNTATITVGGDTYTWWVGYADTSNVGRIFTTSAAYNGALGGLSGADSKCNTLASAAGLGTGWKAVLSTAAEPAINRIPFNWGVLKTPNNVVVANSWIELWSGTLVNAPAYSETGASRSSYVYTGTDRYGQLYPGYNCTDWTDNSGGNPGVYFGYNSDNSYRWIGSGIDYCYYAKPFYCMK